MKKLTSLLAVAVLCACSNVGMADDGPVLKGISSPAQAFGQSVFLGQNPPPAPAPEGEVGPAPRGHVGPAPQPVPAGEVQLFHCVKYKDLDEMAPCAKPMIVSVPDPCACHNPCSCCAPKCVNIKICVPSCGCPPKVDYDDDEVTYDFGEYEVDVRIKKGYIEVDYQD